MKTRCVEPSSHPEFLDQLISIMNKKLLQKAEQLKVPYDITEVSVLCRNINFSLGRLLCRKCQFFSGLSLVQKCQFFSGSSAQTVIIETWSWDRNQALDCSKFFGKIYVIW